MIHSGGFFSDDEIPVNHSINAPTCASCGLSGKCNWPKSKPYGEGKKHIYIIKSSPSQEEDQNKGHWDGGDNDVLLDLFKKKKIDVHSDCIVDYAVRCYSDKEISHRQIEACHGRVWDDVRKAQPKVVLLFGTEALQSFLHNRWLKGNEGIATWRGFVIPDRMHKAWVLPTYDLSFVNSIKKKQPVIKTLLKQDVDAVLSHLDIDFVEYRNEWDCIKYLFTEEQQIQWFKQVCDKAANEKVLLSFDYESTGLKPHAPEHRIACCSMCVNEDEAVVFPFPLSDKAMRWFKRILTHANIDKSAHNMKFEDTWTRVLLGTQVAPWKLCTMIASHVIDNRPGITGLKFQSAVNFGLMSYDEDISPYLKGLDEKNSNSLNRVLEAPRAKLLQYCGIDSLVQYRLAIKQMRHMGFKESYL